MQLSALLALIPLAAALPQSRGPVEARDECAAQLNSCGSHCRLFQFYPSIQSPCADECYKAFGECKSNRTESLDVEAPVEARAVEVETRDSKWEECAAQLNSCGSHCRLFQFYPSIPSSCAAECYNAFDECRTTPVKARAVEVETRDNNEDNCLTAYVDCSHSCPVSQFDEFVGAFKGPCHSQCNEVYEQCTANQTEKRSVEVARDNGSEATTACYGNVASCKHKGTPVAECYSNLARCIEDVLQKFT
ncbi:hypothetical protein V8C40DRAFT_280611 [Trichoderma camerunense]